MRDRTTLRVGKHTGDVSSCGTANVTQRSEMVVTCSDYLIDVVVEERRRIERYAKYLHSDTAIEHLATQVDDGRPGFRRPGLVPKRAASDLSGLIKKKSVAPEPVL